MQLRLWPRVQPSPVTSPSTAVRFRCIFPRRNSGRWTSAGNDAAEYRPAKRQNVASDEYSRPHSRLALGGQDDRPDHARLCAIRIGYRDNRAMPDCQITLSPEPQPQSLDCPCAWLHSRSWGTFSCYVRTGCPEGMTPTLLVTMPIREHYIVALPASLKRFHSQHTKVHRCRCCTAKSSWARYSYLFLLGKF
jgi:hypothetical protein